MGKPTILAKWPTASGTVVRVTLHWFRGHLRFDAREWYRHEGKLLPGRKGISIDPRRLRKLGKAVKRARLIVKSQCRIAGEK